MAPEGTDTNAGTASTTNGTVTVTAAAQSEPVLGPDGQPLDPKRAVTALGRIKDLEAKAARADELEVELKRRDQDKLSTEEKLQTRVSDLEAEKLAWERERQEVRVSNAVRDAAAKAGARYPDAVFRLIDLSSLDYESDGAPKNLDKAVEKVKAAYPEFFNGTQGPGKVAAGARQVAASESMDDWLRQRAGIRP